jgi:itaconate CoA-transferase
MLECLTEWMMPPLYVWKGTGTIPARVGVRHNMIVPYGAYRCADGEVIFAIQSQREWLRFCRHVMPELEQDQFADNTGRVRHRAEIEAAIEDRFSRHTRAEVLDWLERADIPTGVVNDVPAVAAHPQLAARERWTSVESPTGAIPALIPPHNLRRAAPRMGAVPALGEHTEEILAELEENNA